MNDEAGKPRHMDGSPAAVETEFIRVTFQHGPPHDVGVNGCRLEDVVDILTEKLLDFQSRALACAENDTALYHIGLAKEALELRRKRREQQGVIGTDAPHVTD